MSFVGKTASVFGVVGLSAIATLGVVESAEGAIIPKGMDQIQTASDATFFEFDGIGNVAFQGRPIDPQKITNLRVCSKRDKRLRH